MANLKDIMSDDVLCCTPNDNIYEVAVMMRDNEIGYVPVVEGKKLLGVITDRDLVIRSIAEKHPGSTSVMDVMTKDCVTGTPDMRVEEAAKLMAKKEIRRLPVVENGKLIGVVALGDMAARDDFSAFAGEALKEISESPNTLQ